MKKTVLLVFAASVMIGCGGYTVRESFEKYGLNRAVYEMDCPADQLKLTPLGRTDDDSAYAGQQIGVDGCGKRAVYVLGAGAGWVLNNKIPTPAADAQ